MTCNNGCKKTRRRRKLITIEKPKTAATGATVNASGHIDVRIDANWETHTKAYAEAMTRGGREFFRAAQVDATLSHLWMVTSSEKVRTIGPEMRIKWDGRTFNILSALNKNEDNQESEISTLEAV